MATGSVLKESPEPNEKKQHVPVIETQGLKKHFALRSNLLQSLIGQDPPVLKAVDGVDIKIYAGETFGLAGESGCGKSTFAQVLLRMYRPTEGTVLFNGRDIFEFSKAEVKEYRRKVQLVFQNPFEALNPRFTIARSIMEPLLVHGIGSTPRQRLRRVYELMELVNLSPAPHFAHRYPSELSGGQLQRAVLARALAPEPEFLVADEPVSMLDVSVRASVLNLLRSITRDMGLTTLYISHDLSLIRYMCDTMMVMYLGQAAEIGSTGDVIDDPQHPYTLALVGAVPLPDPDQRAKELQIRNQVPDPVDLPPGCRFQDRCPQVIDICRQKDPSPVSSNNDHRVWCFLYADE